MAYIKKIQGRGVSGVVTAYGEVLFAPGGPVHSWTNRFAARIGAETRKAAPTNKRPRWAHYGKPLRSTITVSRPEFRATKGGARVYAAVGATARHAYYVDQGTGIYGGNGPYPAKVLPPWKRGEPSLYEATWRPTGPGGRKVNRVMIKGQKGQGFFEKGLQRGFARMRMRSFQVPGEGVSQMSEALGSFPRGLEFAGNTVADAAFVAQLNEWRQWRDTAWQASGALGRTNRPERKPEYTPTRSQRTAADAAARLRAQREAQYRATAQAAERRKREAEERVRKLAEQRKKGREKREAEARARAERDRKLREANALRRGNESMRREANEFFERIKAAYPDATFLATTLSDGVVLYRVTYVVDGETVRQQWAYGYAT